MEAGPLYEKLVGMGVSAPYASQLSHRKRKPSMALALRIYREIGVKLGPIEGATKPEIATLERVAERGVA